MNFDATESEEFRLHIRRLLYNYCLTHLTTNYLTYTENLVSEFIEYLQPIPLTDPYSLVLSVDPFQTLSQLHALSSLKPYDETPQTTKEGLAYLKVVMRATPGDPLTERIALNDNYLQAPPKEPFLPALTRRARQNTPKIGKKTKTSCSSLEHAELLKVQQIKLIPVEPVEEEVLSAEDILKVKCQIQPDEFQAVRSLLQTTTDMLRPQKSYKNKYLDHAYLRNVPFKGPALPEEPFMPIFPRARRPRSGAVHPTGHLPDLKGFNDIPNVVSNMIEVEDPDGELSRQNLVIVDGWETIQSSPPSTPTSNTSDNVDQLDELFLASSPNTEPPLFDEIMNSKLEPILIPRSRKIGGKSGVSPHILAGKTLGTFLQPLLKPKIPSAPVLPENKEAIIQRPPSSPTPSSLLGQPPSEVDDAPATKVMDNKMDLRDQDLDSELKVLYAGHDLEDIIMTEALDDKRELMMDVPSLPAPNIHPPSDLTVPRTLSDLLVQPSNTTKTKDAPTQNKANQPLQRFLKKVKGRESLALALSWIPFTVDKKLPSAAELLGVTELFSEIELATEVNQKKMDALLKSLDLSDDCNIDKRWRDFDTLKLPPPAPPLGFEIMRTRKECWRLAKLENRLEVGMEEEEEEHKENDAGNPSREMQDDDEQAAPGEQEDVESERPAKRPRLDADDPNQTQDMLIFSGDVVMGAMGELDLDQLASPQFSASDDKENLPPLSFSSSLPDEGQQNGEPVEHYIELLDYDTGAWALSQSCYNNPEMMVIEDEESFEPLSFGSRQPGFGSALDAESYDFLPRYIQSQADGYELEYSDVHQVSYVPEDNSVRPDELVAEDSDKPGPLALAVEPELASRSLGIAAFAQLRARRIKESKPLPVPQPVVLSFPLPENSPQEQQKTPEEIFDRQTLRLSGDIAVAASVHRYLASVDLIQKHALVCALRSNECAVELVERQSLDGVDLILDPHCAIIFLSVFVLPMRCESFVARVSQQSWNFSRILIIFEAYPEQRAKRSSRKEGGKPSNASDPYAYTLPIVKAIKKFRRDVSIAEGCGTKCPNTRVEYAFANTVQEAALFARMYGDMAETRDGTQGMIWGDREWLASEFSEDEEGRLAGLDGLNRFSASIILCQVSLQDFVDMTQEERVNGFAGFIGVESMIACNADLEARLEVMHVSSEPMEPEFQQFEMNDYQETYQLE